ENCLVIDAGTCITYDFIDAEKNYHGGSISPGLTMRFKAMHEFTGKLPLAAPEWPVDFTGNTTLTSLQTGVAFGMVGEINSFISLYKSRWNGLKVLMCGGDTEFLAKRCESEIFAAPDLVISGLNEILKYNLPHVA
ncbi:MAG TPA: type III pantothenate kinase, partial [Bacteroidia bacterium]|nr:type III pantothenate kinase [Bacteroidia bacterium]